MKTITTSIRIDAPAETIWSALTYTSRYSEWNPFITELTGSLALGERLHVRISPPGGMGMTLRPVVTRLTRERELAWLGSLGIRGLFDGAHSFRIRPSDDGSCVFTHAERFRGPLVPFAGSVLTKTEAGFEMMNRALRDRAIAMTGRP